MRRDLRQIRAFAREEIQRELIGRFRQSRQQRDRRAFRTAAMQRRQHEDDLQARHDAFANGCSIIVRG